MIHKSMIFRMGLGVLMLFFWSSCSGIPHEALSERDVDDTLHKSFSVHAGGTLFVNTDLGALEIRAVQKNRVDISVLRKVDTIREEDAREILDDFQIDFEQRGDDVSVTGRWLGEGGRWWQRWRRKLRVRFVISVPIQYNVDVRTAGGSISVEDLEGEVKSKTSGGSLRFGHIRGPVYGRTSGGRITLAGCRGRAEVRTSGGSIRIGEVDGTVTATTSGGSIEIDRAAGPVRAETSGGSIHVKEVMGAIEATTSGGTIEATISRQPADRCYLKTSGGNVYVYLGAEVAVDLDASTSGGFVETDFPVTIQGRIDKHSLHARVNGGGPKLVLRTSGGSIYLKKM